MLLIKCFYCLFVCLHDLKTILYRYGINALNYILMKKNKRKKTLFHSRAETEMIVEKSNDYRKKIERHIYSFDRKWSRFICRHSEYVFEITMTLNCLCIKLIEEEKNKTYHTQRHLILMRPKCRKLQMIACCSR